MKNVNPIATQQYIEKANHFFTAMQMAALELPQHRTGIALLAVHSAISLNDAITTGLTGKTRAHQDHTAAAKELEHASRKHHIANMNGVTHLRWLLAEKTRIAYDRERLDDETVLMAVLKAERFQAWAYNFFREILDA